MATNSSYTVIVTVPKEVLLFSVVFKFVALCLGAMGNIAVIIYNVSIEREITAASCLITNLAVADLLVCLTFYPIWISEFLQTILGIDSDQDLFCKLSRSTLAALLFVSIATLSAITIDRYLFIVKPFRYPFIVTCRRTFHAILAIWIIASGLCVLIQFYYEKLDARLRTMCRMPENMFWLINIFFAYFPLISIFLLNFRILNVARKQRKRIMDETMIVNNPNEQSRKTLSSILHILLGVKAAKTFFIVVIVLVIGFLAPILVGSVARFICTSESCWLIWSVVVNFDLLGINSIANPFIYGLRHTKYRKAYGRIIFKLLRCQRPTG